MSQTVAVLVPYYKTSLTADEEQSWCHLKHYLGMQNVILIVPQNLKLDLPVVRRKEFSSHHFDSIAAYSRLLLSREFFEQFLEFEYILIYQLDCLALSFDLTSWCAAGWSYIGAPLFAAISDPNSGFSRIGNGGLSLRNVEASLRVLTSKKIPDLRDMWGNLMPDVPRTSVKKRLQVIRAARRGVDWYTGHYSLNEDLFWSDRARLFDPSFSLAPIKVGLQFSFDAHPRFCFDQNERRLPFGAHAWTKWDRSFWEPVLIKA